MPTMSGAEYMARTFEAYGVSAVFLVPTILVHTLYEMENRTDIKRIVTHGEKSAAYMADGYARATGRPGVCAAQNVGAANLAAALRDPYLGCSPVVAFTGGPFDWSRGRHTYQEIEDFPLYKPVTHWSGQVFEAQRLPDMFAQAFRAACVGKPGPTHLELAGHMAATVEQQEFEAEIPDDGPFQTPMLRMAPDPDAIGRAARVLRDAGRPVIVAGGGVRTSGAGAELIALAERLGAPVATSLNAKDTVPGDHRLNIGVPGLYSRASANQVLLEADVVFFVGSQTGSQVTLSWEVPPPQTQVVHLDIEPSELGRHYPHTVPVLADAKLGLADLLAAVGDFDAGSRAAWVERAQELGRHWRADTAARFESDQVPMRPERICAELTRLLPDDALLVSDTGHAGMWTGGYVDLTSPGQGFIRAAGSLGWGLPAAIGAKIGAPDRPVVLFTGDGGLWYHLGELETAVRWKVPVVIVVNNNRSLNQEIGSYSPAWGGELHGRHHELWHFEDIDLAAVAESIGVKGLRVKKPSEMDGAMEQALESDGPVLIDAVSDMEIIAPKGVAVPATD
ncbi:MAG: thiamine pyrophosphate-binding protein [Propionibacteriales bacterium]|nr:thiamine pyrophosphate-binding protein [Propionibacteriales bacterium]